MSTNHGATTGTNTIASLVDSQILGNCGHLLAAASKQLQEDNIIVCHRHLPSVHARGVR